MSLSVSEMMSVRADTEQLMVYHCTIVRPTGGHSWESEGTDTAHLSDQPCFYGSQSASERRATGETRYVRRAVLLLPADTDVLATDRVTSVTDVTGTEILGVDVGIEGEPVIYPSHVSIMLQGAS